MNFIEEMFQGINEDEIIEMLEVNAAEIHVDHFYMRQLSPEELATEKDLHAKKSIQIEEKEAKFAEISKEYRDAIKKLKSENSFYLLRIKTGQEERHETVYEMHDVTAKKIYLYNKRGEMIHSRRMRGTQLSILSHQADQEDTGS